MKKHDSETPAPKVEMPAEPKAAAQPIYRNTTVEIPEEGSGHMGAAMMAIIHRTGMSPEHVATEMGINRRTIYLWKTKEVLSKSVIDRVGQALGIDMYAAGNGVFGQGKPVTVKPNQNKMNETAEFWREEYLKMLTRFNDLQGKYVTLLEANAR